MAYRPNKAKAHQRYYGEDGKPVPGVTTIVGQRDKGGLVSWALGLVKEGYNYYDYMADVSAVGTGAHELVVAGLEKRPPDTRDLTLAQIETAQICRDAFLNWVEDHKLELIWAERQMTSKQMRVGGTPDIYCRLDDVLTVLDLKTSDSGLKLDNFVQVAAYAKMAAENGNEIEQVGVVRIGKDGTPAEVKLLPWGEGDADKALKLFKLLRLQYDMVRVLKKNLGVRY